MMIPTIVKKYGHGFVKPKPLTPKSPYRSGWARPVIPFVPFVYGVELRMTTGTISPKPSVTIAR